MISTLPPPPSSPIKSLQTVSIAIGASSNSNTATITSVDTAKSAVLWQGQEGGDATDVRIGMARLVLTDATTVTATRATNDGVRGLTVKAQVVEFY